MRSWYKQILKFLVFLCISFFLFWLVYRDQNWSDLRRALEEEVNYSWVAVVCVVGILSHVVRALRWQLLTLSMGCPIRLMNSFFGVMIGYFANLAIPRMGEFTRCGVVSKYEHVPFPKLLGTVVAERVIDMFFIGVHAYCYCVAVSGDTFFLDTNKGVEERFVSLAHSWKIWMVIVVVPLAVYGMWRLCRGTKLQQRLGVFLSGLKEGILAIRKVKQWACLSFTQC